MPIIRYTIHVSGTDATTADITLRDNEGDLVLFLDDAPLIGEFLFPGASVNPPDWPGWKLLNGVWVLDDTDDEWRQGLSVHVSVNPEADTTVGYPAATEACANPPQQSTTTSTVPTSTIPKTGADTTTTISLMALLTLVFGGTAVAIARRP